MKEFISTEYVMRSMYRDYVHEEETFRNVTMHLAPQLNSGKSPRDTIFDAFIKSQPAPVHPSLQHLKHAVSGRHLKRIVGQLRAIERTSGGGTRR